MLVLGESASVRQKSRREPASVPCPARTWGSISDVAGGTSASRVL